MAAEMGNGLALCRLAFLKTHGRHEVKVCLQKAEEYRIAASKVTDATLWLRKASHCNFAPAQFALGVCYYNGIAVPPNDELAFFWCERAASQGLAPAQNIVGNMFVGGFAVDPNPQIAMNWYAQAAIAKDPAAMYNIGTLFERGLGVQTSLSKAIDWYTRAAAYGSLNAHNVLGIFSEQGADDTNSPCDAVYHYRMAAIGGHNHAQYNLARCYHDGFGVSRCDYNAFKWFKKAADQKHVLAQLSTAICLEHGLGTTRNLRKAYEYFWSAMHNGSSEAALRLVPIIRDKFAALCKIILNDRNPRGFGMLPLEVLIQILEQTEDLEMLDKNDIQKILDSARGVYRTCDADVLKAQIANVTRTICSCSKACTKIGHTLMALEEVDLSRPASVQRDRD